MRESNSALRLPVADRSKFKMLSMYPRAAWLATGLVLATLAGACGDNSARSALITSNVRRVSADPSLIAPVDAALDRFGGELFQELARIDEGNIVFSPYSVAVALAMTRAGAAGSTLTQLDDAMHLRGVAIEGAMNAIDQALATRSGRFDQDGRSVMMTLRTANALWPQSGYPFLRPFLDTLATYYGAGLRVVDYRKTDAARRAINQWVSDATAEKIPELIPAGVLSDLTRLVLTNAIYLNAPWSNPFEVRATADGAFTRRDGTARTTAFMHKTETLGYMRGPDWEAVELPYTGGELTMTLVIPDHGKLSMIERRMAEGFAPLASALTPTAVELAMPKFKFRTHARLNDSLVALGITDLFDPDLADLTAMTTAERLFVSDVIHEAFIDVRESGTEAAAATAVITRATAAPSTPVRVIVDRPFLFAIGDRDTGAVLFLGRVVDPGVSAQ